MPCHSSRQVQMLSQSKIQAGAKNYYLELGKEDYYTENNSIKGRWMGTGAAYFDLEKNVIEKNDKAFTNLMNGKDKKGEKELRRGGGTVKIYRHKETKEVEKKSNPVCGYDNTFSAPKDVSLLWALSDKETQDKILKIHQEAVQAGVSYIEDAVYTRTHSRNSDGTRTIEWHKAKGTFAAFDHFTSREFDPQLHTHVVLLNIGVRVDGKGTGAIDGNKLWKARYIAGQAYQNHLRRELEKEFGVVTFDRGFSEEKGASFGIDGVTQTQRDRFSLRSLQIKKEITHEMTGAQINAVALKTRQAKRAPLAPDLLFGEWKERGQVLGFDPYKIMGKQSIGQKVTEKIAQKIDTYYDKKDRDSNSRITTDEKITRDVAGSLKRQVQYRLDKQAELQEKVKEYNERKADFIQRKLAEGMTEKEATKLHASVYKKPQINERKLLDPNVGTVTKESVMLAYMKFNQDATKIQAHTFTDQFVSKYMSGEEKKIHPIDKEKREKKGQTFAPKDQNNVVYKLNEKGQDLAVQRTKREELVNTITTIVKARQDINYKIKDVTFKLKEQSFNMKLLGLYSTGKIDQRKYIQLRDQKYLEYSKFKLAVLQTFGVLSARQVRQAWRAQKREYNPNSFIRTAVREGRLSKEEAQELRYKVFAEVKEAKRLEKEALDSRAIAKAQEGRSQSQSSSRFDYERERGFG